MMFQGNANPRGTIHSLPRIFRRFPFLDPARQSSPQYKNRSVAPQTRAGDPESATCRQAVIHGENGTGSGDENQ